MAITVVTRPEQGYTHVPGNIIDAATGALALYNLPKSMKLQMQNQALRNKALGQATDIQGKEFGQEQTGWGRAGRQLLNSQYDPQDPNPGGMTSGSNPNQHSDDGIMGNSPFPNTKTQATGEAPPPANTSTTSAGSNDHIITGTSANEHMKGWGQLDPTSTASMTPSALHNSQAIVLSASPAQSDSMPSPSTAGPNARGDSLPQSQGGGPAGSPFPSKPRGMEPDASTGPSNPFNPAAADLFAAPKGATFKSKSGITYSK